MIRNAKSNYEKRVLNINMPSKQLWSNIKRLGVSKDNSSGIDCYASSDDINRYCSSDS